MKNNNLNSMMAVYDLLNLINQSRSENNDTLIAKKLIEYRYDLDQYSLDNLSREFYFSQATLSRFIKKIGYQSYNDFKNNIARSNFYIEEVNSSYVKKKVEDIRQETYTDIIKCVECIQKIDIEHLVRIVDQLKSYKNIYFMGSELSMAITHLLQMGLISLEKNVYTIYDFHYQKEILYQNIDDTLIIFISLEQRAYSVIKKELSNNDNYKMLWAINRDHSDQKIFDECYFFGDYFLDNLGYNELIYFILLIYRILLNT